MPRVSPNQNNFNAGELSPTLEGRTDFEKYKSGCYLMENFIPLVQGPAERRPGTHQVAAVKDSLVRTWLLPFHFNQTQSYVMELGDRYMRFYFARGQLIAPSGGLPYEIVAPWPSNDITNTDGTFRPTFAQSNDVMFWANFGYFPQILERRAHTDWRFRQFALDTSSTSFRPRQLAYQWPFGSQNLDTGKRLYVTPGALGSVNLIASSGAIFESWMVGQLMEIQASVSPDPAAIVPSWEPAKVVAATAYCRVENRVYQTLAGGTTGTVRPTHTDGVRSDGNPGVLWTYLHSGYCVIQIDSVVDSAHATGTPIMPVGLVISEMNSATSTTSRWRLAAWQTHDGFPTLTFFFRERLGFCRGTTIWLSAPGDFFNFAELDPNGDVTDDQAITVSLASDTADSIRWARETPNGLLVGTDGGEWLVDEADTSAPLSPSNIRARRQSAYGTRPIQPVSVQSAILYVQRGGRKLREAMWALESESIKSRDVTVLSEHITEGGITSLAFQQEPRSTLWATRADGELLSFTYNLEQDVYGWHRHPMGGEGVADCVASIPSPDGNQDDLWVIVHRTINGNQGRYVEWLDPGFKDGDDIATAWYVDCGASYVGIPASTISGLDYLEGMLVDILADGSPQSQRRVVGGVITLDSPASHVIVGLPSPARLATMRRDEGAADGTAQGKLKRAPEAVFRFLRTVGAKVGLSPDVLETVDFRDSSMPMSGPIPPFTGDKRVPLSGNSETEARIWVVQDQPLPMTLAMIAPQLITQDKG